MALETDDCDIREVYLQTMVGGNGDYYISLYEYPTENGFCEKYHSINYRMAMSGGFASKYPEVREAMVSLFRAMEKNGLNEFPEPKIKSGN